MSIKSRAESVDLAASLGEKLVSWGPPVFGTLGFGTLSAWVGKLTTRLGDYAPLSWLVCGSLGAIVFLLAYWIWCGARLKLVMYRLTQRIEVTRDHVNPLDSSFTGRRVDLASFASPLPRPVKDKTFVNCELFGPAIIFIGGNAHFDTVEFSQCDFVLVQPGARMQNVIPMIDMTMRGGVMHNTTVYVTPGAANGLPANVNWLTFPIQPVNPPPDGQQGGAR